jgi:hypothetical protein
VCLARWPFVCTNMSMFSQMRRPQFDQRPLFRQLNRARQSWLGIAVILFSLFGTPETSDAAVALFDQSLVNCSATFGTSFKSQQEPLSQPLVAIRNVVDPAATHKNMILDIAAFYEGQIASDKNVEFLPRRFFEETFAAVQAEIENRHRNFIEWSASAELRPLQIGIFQERCRVDFHDAC